MTDERDSFARRYLTHVALGEGCNCAESVIRTWEQGRLASNRPGILAVVAGVVRRSRARFRGK